MNRSQDDKYLASLKKRYVKASKKERGQILDEYVQTIGYHRTYAAAVLSGQVQRAPRPIHRPRHTLYTVEDARALDTISDIFDGMNAKLLRAAMDVELDPLVESGTLKISPECHARLKHISPASIDRLRARYGRPRAKSRHRTKPGTLLKSQIPIRTWADWDEDRPGFVEIDLVGHDGGNLRGDYCLTLDVTEEKGVLAAIAAEIAKHDGNIVSLATFSGRDSDDRIVTAKVTGAPKDALLKSLEEARVKVLNAVDMTESGYVPLIIDQKAKHPAEG